MVLVYSHSMFYKARIKGTSLDVVHSLHIRIHRGLAFASTFIGDNYVERLMPGHMLGCFGYFRWKLLIINMMLNENDRAAM